MLNLLVFVFSLDNLSKFPPSSVALYKKNPSKILTTGTGLIQIAGLPSFLNVDNVDTPNFELF